MTASLPTSPRRAIIGAHLFVPGNRAGFLTRLPVLPVRAVILDLEYATRWADKHQARYMVAEAIPYLHALRPELHVSVRVNVPAAGALAERDLEVVALARPDAIRVPTVEHPDDLRRLDAALTRLEHDAELEPGSITLHPMIETPAGLRRIADIAAASPRNRALCLGGEDWAHNVGARRTRAGHELDLVRAAIVAVAAERRLVAIDTVYNWLDDDDGLRADSQRSRALGFRGRATIHPRQVASIAEAYAPEPAELERAQRLLAHARALELDGRTLQLVDGVITDPAALFQAQLTADAAELARG